MTKHSLPVWKMDRDALEALGGDHNWIQLINVVNKVHERWPDVNGSTIRCQMRMRCVNGHPGHDEYPDKGKMWREQPTFVSNHSGKYRLYNKERDYAIYLAALKEDGLLINEVPEPKTQRVIKPPPPVTPAVDIFMENGHFNDPIGLLEKYGHQLGFKTQREWPVPLGRIDLVWYVEIPVMLPQTQTTRYPSVGFEIETSWRTRKHIKGDIQNLKELKAPLGVILQLTSSKDYPTEVANLIRNVKDFLKGSGSSNILIWTEEDLTRLGEAIRRELGDQ